MPLKELRYESFGIYEIQTQCKEFLDWLEKARNENEGYEFTIEVKALISDKE